MSIQNLGYTGLGTTEDYLNPNFGPQFSMGTMSPATTGRSSTQSATAAAVSAAPVTPSGVANPATAPDAAATEPMFNPYTGEHLNPTFFQKGGGFSIALGALQTLGNLWNSYQQNKIAKDQLNFQKQAYQTNLANFEKDYNTRLASDVNYSYAVSGKSDQEARDYIQERSL